jgi:hypothetical protein
MDFGPREVRKRKFLFFGAIASPAMGEPEPLLEK